MTGFEIALLIILAYAYYLISQSDKKINKAFELAENMRVMWHEENIAHQKTKAELELYKNHESQT